MNRNTPEYSDLICYYWDKYINNNVPLPLKLDYVPDFIFQSWKRSQNYNLSPHKIQNVTLSKEALNALREKNKLLISVAEDHMKKMYSYVKGEKYAFVLVEKNGYVIDLLADDDMILEKSKGWNLELGCSRLEKNIGTSGIALCLENKIPYALYANEQYMESLRSHHGYVCCSAPIFSEQQELLGVFSLIGPNEQTASHTLGMVVASAKSIEREIQLKLSYEEIKKINNNLKFILNTLDSGILLINRDGEIVRNNTPAKEMLREATSLKGKLISEYLLDSTLIAEIIKGQKNILSIETNIKVGPGKNSQQTVVADIVYNTDNSSEIIIKLEKSKTVHKRVSKIVGFSAKYTFSSIIGSSPEIEYVKQIGKIAANSMSNFLILGESGTGKDVLAQAIHNGSKRSEGPFIAINCASIPNSLIESELFGYEAGAFTGANKNGNPGKFELADGGTLFLDEIGDMPLDLQATLLRVLQNKEITRIGGKKPIPIDVRIIAATNSDLLSAVSNNLFRGDLFYRLNVLSVEVPPLRERKSDIPELVHFFLQIHGATEIGKVYMTNNLIKKLMDYSWPGNVRELENIVERYIVMVENGIVDFDKLIPTQPQESNKLNDISVFGAKTIYKKTTKETIIDVLTLEHGNISRASMKLGVSKRTLYRRLEKYSINADDYRFK